MKSPLKQTGATDVEYDYQPGASGVPFGQILPETTITRKKYDPAVLFNQNATVSGDFSDPYNASIMSPASDQFKLSFGQKFGANLKSPQAMMGIASGIGGIFQGLFGRTRRRNEQREAQRKYDDMMEMYQRLDISNLYEDVENQFLNMENPMEDLTVNQKQAEFERQMFQQQQANIMQGLQGAAGGSGIAALAQAMANQGLIQAQRASASIGMQESRNQMAAAQQAARIQMAERAGAAQADQLRLAGAERARGLEYQKVGTELGMAQQELAARNRAIAQADAALYGGLGSLVGTFATAGLGAIK
jgi:hypothetical protein